MPKRTKHCNKERILTGLKPVDYSEKHDWSVQKDPNGPGLLQSLLATKKAETDAKYATE